MLFILLLTLSCCRGESSVKPSGEELRNAILLTVAAGFSTVIGAGVAFCARKEDLKKERSTFLAAFLSFAASVMVYVSLIEIWQESLENFEEVTEDGRLAHIYTSLTFFGGVVVGVLFSLIVRRFDNVKRRQILPTQSVVQTNPSQDERERANPESLQMSSPNGPGHTEAEEGNVQMSSKDDCGYTQSQTENEVTVNFEDVHKRKAQLLRTSIVTAISIALHNFPEGIMTFVAALADWKVGVATAFAIGIHNIPEGIAIAIPYFYASGSRWKAFAMAFLSGLAEPIGALLGWLIFDNLWGPEVFGLMFGLTAGIMVFISFHELLPLAIKNDPDNKVTTIMIFAGMLVMDVSLFIAA